MASDRTEPPKTPTDRSDDAPLRTKKDDTEEGFAHVGRSVLISRPRQELFAFWRDFQNLPQFMENIESIRSAGANDAMIWTVKAPAGQTVEIETRPTTIVEGESISWKSTDRSQIATRGSVTFIDAPAGRGTVVIADIAYQPPAGDLGRLVAKLFSAEPNVQARHELKRFKMLMETGEISIGANHIKEEA